MNKWLVLVLLVLILLLLDRVALCYYVALAGLDLTGIYLPHSPSSLNPCLCGVLHAGLGACRRAWKPEVDIRYQVQLHSIIVFGARSPTKLVTNPDRKMVYEEICAA